MIFIDTTECTAPNNDFLNNNIFEQVEVSQPKKKYSKPMLTYSNNFDNEYIENVFPDIIEYWIGDFPYNTYKCSSDKLITLRCNKDHTWTRTINNHVKPGYFNCCICFFEKYPKLSKKYWYWGESACAYILKKINITFKYQYKFFGWYFDFYFDGKLLEFDGPQHFNKKYLDAINSSHIINNDILKTKLCIDNNIPLLRISYKEIVDIEYWLNKFINSDLNIMFSNPHLYSHLPK